jgi:hypothetical protein
MDRLSLPSKASLIAPFRSKEAFIEFVKAPRNNNGHIPVGDPKWSNKDLEPTPVEHRNWTWCVLQLRASRPVTDRLKVQFAALLVLESIFDRWLEHRLCLSYRGPGKPPEVLQATYVSRMLTSRRLGNNRLCLL